MKNKVHIVGIDKYTAISESRLKSLGVNNIFSYIKDNNIFQIHLSDFDFARLLLINLDIRKNYKKYCQILSNLETASALNKLYSIMTMFAPYPYNFIFNRSVCDVNNSKITASDYHAASLNFNKTYVIKYILHEATYRSAERRKDPRTKVIDYEKILTLYYINGYSMKECATELDINPHTISNTLEELNRYRDQLLDRIRYIEYNELNNGGIIIEYTGLSSSIIDILKAADINTVPQFYHRLSRYTSINIHIPGLTIEMLNEIGDNKFFDLSKNLTLSKWDNTCISDYDYFSELSNLVIKDKTFTNSEMYHMQNNFASPSYKDRKHLIYKMIERHGSEAINAIMKDPEFIQNSNEFR